MKTHLIAATLVVFLCNNSLAEDYSRETEICDDLASHPQDMFKRKAGVNAKDVDVKYAFEFCRKAALSQDMVSLYQLGRLYDLSGRGQLAVHYYYLAQDKGHAWAGLMLAELAAEHHITIAAQPSLTWRDLSIIGYRKAARYGIEGSALELGRIGDGIYYGRQGYYQNRSFGEELLRDAARFGDPTSKEVLKDIVLDKNSRNSDSIGSSDNNRGGFDPDRNTTRANKRDFGFE